MSSSVSHRLQTAVAHHQSGRLREAEAIYRSVLGEQPDNPNALYLLGVVALQTGQPEAARDLLDRTIAISPDYADAYNMCGDACSALGQYDEAIGHYRRAIELQPQFAGAHNNLGNLYMTLGRFDDAAGEYRRAISISPEFALSHNNLGLVLKALGQLEEALEHFQRAVAIAPGYAEAYSNAGNALRDLNRPQDAAGHYERAIAANPDFAEAHNNLGTALKDLGRYDDAVDEYKKALELNPDFAMAFNNLGLLYDETGRPQDAIDSYEKAIAVDPDFADARNNLGNMLFQLGQRDDAAEQYRRAIAIRPTFAEAYRHLANLHPDAELAAEIEEQIGRPGTGDTARMHYLYALANIYDTRAQYETAFDHYAAANRIRRTTLDYDADDHARYVNRLIETFSPALRGEAREWGSKSELPVFIVGMPRSGTTLVEQIVASHPQVQGAGELPLMAGFEQAIPGYPAGLRECGRTVAADASHRYLEALRTYSDTAIRITDKAPSNFLRVGLIRLLLPNARIVHCRRNALDTCVSMYFNYFVSGNEYSYDLEELGRYYSDYLRLMTHWRDAFAADMFEVRYEDVVADQEATTRKLIDSLGLEWDPACLDFHSSQRAVRTASSMQVREPIYDSSVDRWRHYEEQLAPLMSLLGVEGQSDQ
jgi:tetratricopeptide (TPR) repeat protein